MRNILEELWYGNICPNTGYRESTPPAKQLMGYIADHHDNLQATLTEEQKEVLEKFDDCYAELTDINEREIFAYAFRLGARIMLDVMLPRPRNNWKQKKTTHKILSLCVVFSCLPRFKVSLKNLLFFVNP